MRHRAAVPVALLLLAQRMEKQHPDVNPKSADEVDELLGDVYQVFLVRLDQIVARGESDDGTVVVTRIGDSAVTVDLPPDALELLGEAGIAEATARATEAMMGDRRRQVLQARREVYYPEIS